MGGASALTVSEAAAAAAAAVIYTTSLETKTDSDVKLAVRVRRASCQLCCVNGQVLIKVAVETRHHSVV